MATAEQLPAPGAGAAPQPGRRGPAGEPGLSPRPTTETLLLGGFSHPVADFADEPEGFWGDQLFRLQPTLSLASH